MQRSEDTTLIEQVAILRADLIGLDRRVTVVEGYIPSLRSDIESRHQENRASIHELHIGQQDIITLIHTVDLKLARGHGYAIGAGATVALLAQLIQHLWK